MNKIYKVLKNNATGCFVAVSELATGVKKGRKLKLTSLLLLAGLSSQAYGAISIPQGYNPAVNNNKFGSIKVSGSGQVVDLGIGDGLNSASLGSETHKYTLTINDKINTLYQTKYADVANAQSTFNQVQNQFNNGLATQAELDNAQNKLEQAKVKAQTIDDSKFTVSDPNNVLGKNTESTSISIKTIQYADPVTGKIFELVVNDNAIKNETTTNITTNKSIDFYEKMPNNQQYQHTQLITVSGSDTDLTIENTNPGSNNYLSAISKNAGTAIIELNDGANLTFDTDVNYYTGNESNSVSDVSGNSYQFGNQQEVVKVTYKGDVDTVLGSRNISSEADFNKFNKELIKYIQQNEQVRLDNPTPEMMKAFYDAQISKVFSSREVLGSYSYAYNLDKNELDTLAKEQGLQDKFNNRVTEADRYTDIGLQATVNNRFLGVTGSGSKVTVNENTKVDSIDSSGVIINAAYTGSGVDSNNIFNINGTLDAHGKDALIAKNAEIYVASTGTINGNVTLYSGDRSSGNHSTTLIENAGLINGVVSISDGTVKNKTGAIINSINGQDQVTIVNDADAIIRGKVIMNQNGSLNNSGTISDSVTAKDGSIVKNNNGATIGGVVIVSGVGTTFENDGVAGGAHTAYGAASTNNNILIGDGVVALDNKATLVNNGQIYIGYQYDSQTQTISNKSSNKGAYTAITVAGEGSELINNKDVYVSSSQHDVKVVQVSDGGHYADKADSIIVLNKENNPISDVDKNRGNDNKVIYVSDRKSAVTINGTITLNDVGSTALWTDNGGQITLAGTVNLNGQNAVSSDGESAVRSFGAWVQGENAKLIMNGNSAININADRAIGVHIRDGASAEINDHAGLTFSDKNNQIGFLISGISKPASIIYNSDKELLLDGEGSVLFRIERGSTFNSGTIASNNPSLSILDSNNAKNSILMVVTNGPTATGVSNHTVADLSGFTLKVNGENAKGISVEGGANVKISQNTKIELTGSNSILARVDGNYYDVNGVNTPANNGLSYLESSAQLTTNLASNSEQVVTGQNSVGYYVTNRGTLDHLGSIDFQSPSLNNIGVKIDSGGTLISKLGSYIKVRGTAVEISGSNSLATINNIGNGEIPVVWAIGADGNNNDSAYHVKDNASLKLSGSGITKAQGTAHGILVDGANQIVLDSAILDLYDNNSNSSMGNGIENRSALEQIQLTNNAIINVKDGYGIHSGVGLIQSSQTSGTINVYGQGTGLRFENIDSATGEVTGTTHNSINNSGYENVIINVYENDGHGIYVDSSKNVNTSASVNIISANGQSALEIKGSTETASQSGHLHSANKNAVIVDLNNGHIASFTNNGEVLFGDFAKNGADQYQFTATDKTIAKDSYAIKTQQTEHSLNFTNAAKGNINGIVELLGYGTLADPNDKTQGNNVTLIGEGNIFRTGDGNDTFVIHQAVGDDLGGDNQLKQFTELDGGEGQNSVTFTNNSSVTINNDDTIKHIEHFALDNNSKVTLNNLATQDGLNSGVNTYDMIDVASILTYRWNKDNTAFDRLLNGKGTFSVDLQHLDDSGKPNHVFAFNNTTNTGDFNGTLELSNTQYALQDSAEHSNTSALTQATLKASANSYVTVGAGEQIIKGLTLNGGTVDFGKIDLVNDKSTNHISVDNLVLDKGNIKIDASGSIYNPGIPTSLPLLEQDDGIILTQLVAANNVSGGAINVDIDRTQIKLIDETGHEIASSAKTDLVQNSEVVARATYDTRLTKGENSDGLYVGYGLTQIELKAKNDVTGVGNALILDATGSDPSKASSSELDALITDYDNGDGTWSYGDVQIRGSKAVTLSGTNSYHGSTFIKDTSTLIAGADNALGLTRLLKLDANTLFDLSGHAQSVGRLYSDQNAIINLNNGQLTITGQDATSLTNDMTSYLSSGTLQGSGQLIIGDTSLTRATAGTATLTVIGENSALTADITNAINGKVNLDSQGGLGSGSLTNNGELNLYLSDESVLTNSHLSGNGMVNKYNSGTLNFSLAQAKDYTGEINIKGGAIVFKGDNNATRDSYQASELNIDKGSALIGLENAVFNGNMHNQGNVFIGQLPNSTTVSQSSVTVNDYQGNEGSHLIFNGTLTDDSSPIGKLIINGNSSGNSIVTVNNIGGLGAKTINGIAIIDVNGQSDAEFSQSDRIIAGAYEYKLQRSESNNNNWVLFSDLTARAEIGSYVGNLFSANNLFNLRLYDRVGETQYIDLFTGEQKVTSMWIRHQYGYDKYNVANGDLSAKDHWNITQIGGDIAQWSSNEQNRLHLGVMVGYGRSKTTSTSNIDGSKSDATVDGYSYGAYATWYDNDQDKTGFYLDTWALWNHFDASVTGEKFSESYNISGLTASIESGYSFKTGQLGNYDVWLQPQAQAIWANAKADDFTESNGTRVSFSHGNLQTRFGIRAALLSNAQIQAITNQSAQFFVEANWLHNTKLYDVTLNDELTLGQDGARNIGEIKVGVEGNIEKNTSLWLNLAGQRGDHDYKNASIMLGLKYSF
ncbi:autotransporter family porin [Orbus hercynius]|uniref:Autotransporter family porin n=1 Tax=Orbus hercynius TaxID=593135 RepID=A0A495RJ85_9GAMM|nr:autotransporter outer membrane beta-barrel domain-containing protein [Orbus hercynius]RKS87354.1 autotransporter family porin [Orbus hercynius]